jgi:hypothetical protein
MEPDYAHDSVLTVNSQLREVTVDPRLFPLDQASPLRERS